MATTVVNLRKSEYDVYIGRGGRGQDGYFGNPVKVGESCPICGVKHKSKKTLPCYRTYLMTRIAKDPEFKARVMSLHGKRLACFCKPRACHGDILAEVVDRLVRNDGEWW